MSSGSTRPFSAAGTATIPATTSSANAALPTAGETMLVFNATAATAFVKLGADGTVTASTSVDFPVPAGGSRLLHCGNAPSLFLAVILSSGSGNVYASRGDGSIY